MQLHSVHLLQEPDPSTAVPSPRRSPRPSPSPRAASKSLTCVWCLLTSLATVAQFSSPGCRVEGMQNKRPRPNLPDVITDVFKNWMLEVGSALLPALRLAALRRRPFFPCFSPLPLSTLLLRSLRTGTTRTPPARKRKSWPRKPARKSAKSTTGSSTRGRACGNR